MYYLHQEARVAAFFTKVKWQIRSQLSSTDISHNHIIVADYNVSVARIPVWHSAS